MDRYLIENETIAINRPSREQKRQCPHLKKIVKQIRGVLEMLREWEGLAYNGLIVIWEMLKIYIYKTWESHLKKNESAKL